MSGAAVRIAVDSSTLQAGFDALLKRSSNLSPLMANIGEMLVAETDDRFDEQQAPDGTPWVQSARAKEEGGKTLTDKRHLRDSITAASDNDSVTVGTNRIYAAIHQFGGTIKAKNGGSLKFAVGSGFAQVKQVDMPARPFLGVNDDSIKEIRFMISDYVLKGDG